mmetsp:Transcript_34206/g.78973  ORF Transcript_34206/g.78973 Transcript_34206/m.78973 type:complete len:392 (-) Transcript_34206:385-1560(-)
MVQDPLLPAPLPRTRTRSAPLRQPQRRRDPPPLLRPPTGHRPLSTHLLRLLFLLRPQPLPPCGLLAPAPGRNRPDPRLLGPQRRHQRSPGQRLRPPQFRPALLLSLSGGLSPTLPHLSGSLHLSHVRLRRRRKIRLHALRAQGIRKAPGRTPSGSHRDGLDLLLRQLEEAGDSGNVRVRFQQHLSVSSASEHQRARRQLAQHAPHRPGNPSIPRRALFCVLPLLRLSVHRLALRLLRIRRLAASDRKSLLSGSRQRALRHIQYLSRAGAGLQYHLFQPAPAASPGRRLARHRKGQGAQPTDQEVVHVRIRMEMLDCRVSEVPGTRNEGTAAGAEDSPADDKNRNVCVPFPKNREGKPEERSRRIGHASLFSGRSSEHRSCDARRRLSFLSH